MPLIPVLREGEAIMKHTKPNKTVSTIFIICGMIGLIALQDSAWSEDGVRLNFGVYSSNKPTAMVRTFKPILNSLESSMSEKLGRSVDIRMQIAKDYDQGMTDLINGKVDFSRFGPASYIQAKKENSSLQLVAMESKKKSKVFYGIIAVHKDSNITNIEQLKGRSFAFGDESSTIGRFLSQLYLVSHNIFAGDLSGYKYLGRHDKVGTAVGAGDFDAGALNESTFKKLVAAGEPIKELARFPNVTKPWIASEGLDPEVFSALQESLYELKDLNALKALKADGFLPGTDEDYETIRASMEYNGRFFQEAAATELAEVSDKTEKEDKPASMVAKSKPFPGGIQINIVFENADGSVSAASDGAQQPIVVNVTIPGNLSESQKAIVTTSR